MSNAISQKLMHLENQSLLRARLVLPNDCVNFASNDYLGLHKHPQIMAAFIRGIECYGFGSGGSPVVSGFSQAQVELEQQFAEWLQLERVIIFNSGYLANLGVMQALLTKNAVVFADKLCHASLIQGIQSVAVKCCRFRSLAHLQQLSQFYQPAMIVSESVFSMEGKIVSLAPLIASAQQHAAMLVVDDAHGMGVLGTEGRSAAEFLPKIQHCLVAPLGKAFNGAGAVVAGDKKTIEVILQLAKTYHYSTALPPAIFCALQTTLKIIVNENWRREQLQRRIQFFIKHALERQLALVSADLTPIKSILIGDNFLVIALQQFLKSKGFWVAAIRPPTVAIKTSRIRISLNCLHSEKQILQLINLIGDFLDEHLLFKWTGIFQPCF